MSGEENRIQKPGSIPKEKPSIANLGIKIFYDALVAQDTKCVQMDWVPPIKQTEEMEELLNEFL